MMAVDSEEKKSITASAKNLQMRFLSAIDNVSSDQREVETLKTNEERLAFLHSSSVLFTQLRAISRKAHENVRNGKQSVSQIRSQVDKSSLALQNLKYQKRHLQEEIKTCKSFQSIYESVPLIEIDEFKSKVSQSEISPEILSNPHALYLARLRFELSERKRLEEEKKKLQTTRTTLVIENRKKKQRLEGLEADLKEMLSKSVQVRNRFEEANRELQQEQQAAAVEGDVQNDDFKHEHQYTTSSTAAATPIADDATPRAEKEGS